MKVQIDIGEIKNKSMIKNKTHARFYSLIVNLPGYSQKNREEIKSEIVRQYSSNNTASLSELYQRYPDKYSEMIEDLKRKTQRSPQAKTQFDPEWDIWAKRVIAVLCNWIDRHNLQFDGVSKIRYAKAVACRAANCAEFNKIPVSRLSEIYNVFLKRNSVGPSVDAIETALLLTEADNMINTIKKQLNIN